MVANPAGPRPVVANPANLAMAGSKSVIFSKGFGGPDLLIWPVVANPAGPSPVVTNPANLALGRSKSAIFSRVLGIQIY